MDRVNAVGDNSCNSQFAPDDFALSTSWNRHLTDGQVMVAQIAEMGLHRIEIGNSLSEQMVEQALREVEKQGLEITSLHTPVPRPDYMLSGERPEPWMTSLDPEERTEAVRLTCQTLENARRFGAPAIVVHVGTLAAEAWQDCHDRILAIREALSAGQTTADPPVARLIEECRELRAQAAPLHYPAMMAAMEQVAECASKLGVKLGLETRVGYAELPFGDEFEGLLSEFGPAGAHYWHDAGHAQVLEHHGFIAHRELLQRFGSRAVGAHLHDVVFPVPDHQVPGRGTVDFRMVGEHLPADALPVMEIASNFTPGEIMRGVAYLQRVLGGRGS